MPYVEITTCKSKKLANVKSAKFVADDSDDELADASRSQGTPAPHPHSVPHYSATHTKAELEALWKKQGICQGTFDILQTSSITI
jgi:hypothetical protein